jgi:SNF2 family DNA or RNA helicase
MADHQGQSVEPSDWPEHFDYGFESEPDITSPYSFDDLATGVLEAAHANGADLPYMPISPVRQEDQLPEHQGEPPTLGSIPTAVESDGAPSIGLGELNFGNSVLGLSQDKKASGGNDIGTAIEARQRQFAAMFRNKSFPGPASATGPGSATGSAPLSQRSDSTEPTHGKSLRSSKSQRHVKLDPEAEEFKKLAANFHRKKRAGTLDILEEIRFMSAESKEKARLGKKKADAALDRTPSPGPDQESGLFVTDARSSVQQESSLDSSDEDELGFWGQASANRPRKRPARMLTNEVRKEQGQSHNKKARLNRHLSSSGFTSSESPAKMGGRTSNPKKGARKHPRERDIGNHTNLASVRSTNVFQDAEAVAHLGDQPVFSERRRPDALKQLIASVPQESRKIASADKKFLDEACKAFNGVGSVYPGDKGNWVVKGMHTQLKHYQVLGTAFMRKRENENVAPKGGILADEMGLGKTIMMLANIVNGKPEKKAKKRCTLIVASPALCNQWCAEIQSHVQNTDQNKKHGIGRVVQHRAGNRLTDDLNKTVNRKIEEADICLTTYSEICRSYPKAIVPTNLTTAAQKDAWWNDYYEDHKGIFHQIEFYRVVLDEAQAIKVSADLRNLGSTLTFSQNHKGHTSHACRSIKSEFYWAITGTPIMNRLSEFYPYFKFLREPNTGSFKIFRENFCSPDDPDGTGKLAVFLRKVMIRRTHLDTLFGARLLDLPPPKQQVVWLSFNETERQIYEIVKSRFIQRINTIAKQENGVVRHYNHIWTMMLRLRQLCSHILLLQDTIIDLLTREDFEKLNSLCKRKVSADDGASILLHLRHVLANSLEASAEGGGTDTVEAGAASATVIPVTETMPMGTTAFADAVEDAAGGKHGKSYNFSKYLRELAGSAAYSTIQARSTCAVCRQEPHEPHITSCFHIYCYACLEHQTHLAARRGHDIAVCVECGAEYTSVQPCQLGPPDDPSSAAASETSSVVTKGKKSKKNGPDWIGMQGEVLPSTKTIAVKAQILAWMDEDFRAKRPYRKIIVYSQFLPIIRIMNKVCRTERWTSVDYTGEMSQNARNKAIEQFRDDPTCTIMLASLRCGGLGLNLTMAARVILIDPWWNSAVEQQAFCRVFRIGQTVETHMTRFVVENTIDAAMMAMKERKEEQIVSLGYPNPS